jgi:hypothetical protein
MSKLNVSYIGKLVALVITSLVIFFIFITSVNSASMLGRQKLDAQKMQDSLKSEYNELVTDLGNNTSQSAILNDRKGKMIPINRDSGDFANLETLQDQYSKQGSKDGSGVSGSRKTVLVK